MKALVIYESMFGNTRVVAEARAPIRAGAPYPRRGAVPELVRVARRRHRRCRHGRTES
jgi:hypothetical protein